MSTAVDMVLADGASTPVNKTFVPIKVTSDLVTFNSSDYSTVSGEVYAARPVITLGNRLPTNKNGNYKATLRVRIPICESSEVSAGIGTSLARPVAYTLTANIDVIIPSLASKSEVDDLLAFVSNSLANAQVVSTMSDMLLPS
jgi:hypothetical protein